jgi:indolepyruvate ferredoxin oxidoreductase beta subunit
MKNGIDVVVAGIGGQGVVRSSDILADAAFRAGFDVKKSELHGMSQRGGSVSSDVRIGRNIFSPMIPDGEADFLLAFRDDQVAVNRHRLCPDGTVIGIDRLPHSVSGKSRSLNVAMLGILSRFLPISFECWIEAIQNAFHGKALDPNLEAFRLGRNEDASIAPTEIQK